MMTAPVGNQVAAARDCSEPGNPRWLVFACLAAVLIGLLLVIPSPAKFHSDEQFYTDAAIHMVQTGDYWTPVYPDGQIRLIKPILTYWAAAASMKLFGISLFAARLPFAVAGVLTVWLTCCLAETLVRNQRSSLLAALILASNIQILTLATRATPDALVCLFVMMSVWGFARIWIGGDSSWVAPMLVYVGMGLAVQTKGLLGLCPAAAAALFWLVARPETGRTRRLLHWPAILAGLAVGSFWYWIMLQRHGLGSMQDFFSDQVGAKVTYGPVLIVGNFAAYSLAGLRHFLPWTLLLPLVLIGCREEIVRWWRQHRRECVFLLCLYAILVIGFSFGNVRRTRYLVAAYPMLAVLLAMMWSHAPFQQGRSRWFGRILNGVAAVLLVLGAGLLAGGIGGDWRLAMGGGIWLATGALGMAAVRSADEYGRLVWLAGVVVAVFAVVGASLRPAFSRVPIAPMVSELLRDQSGAATVYSWQNSGSVDAMLRLVSGGRLEVRVLDADNPDFALGSRVITTTTNLQERLSQAGYSLTAVTVTNAALADSWLGRLVARAEARRKKAAPTYWIAERAAAAP